MASYKWVFICMVMCGAAIMLYSLYSLLQFHPRPEPTSFEIHRAETKSMPLDESQEETQQTRLQLIREGCESHSSFQRNKYYQKYKTRYFVSSVYNFAICDVPKGGSTFLKQALSILETGSDIAETIFATERLKVHRTKQPFSVYKGNKPSTIPSIVVSRDPFSRLFSAYIDKIYLPPHAFEQYRRRCPEVVSFQEFLEVIVSRYLAGNALDPHWAPIYSLCRPCDGNVVALLKQESFSADVTYILETFNVESVTKEQILEALYSNRFKYTISSIIRTIYRHASRTNLIDCMGAKGLAERLWTSFQIQGYVKDTIPFPENVNETSLRNSSFLLDLVMDTIEAQPLSVHTQRVQRKTALVNAYRGVTNETISRIKEIYKADFNLFGYNPESPVTKLS